MLKRVAAGLVALTLGAAACAGSTDTKSGESSEITVYSGRSEKLIGPLLQRFERVTGIKVKARYGDSAELASTILEEGDRSPADVFFAQDAGSLGALSEKKLLAPLPAGLLNKVDAGVRDDEGRWVGTSGRVRVIAFAPGATAEADVPDDVESLTQARWRGQVGWAPTNGSFQGFVTAMRLLRGDAATKAWLQAMKDNGAKVFPNNDAIVEAVGRGEVALGLVNHYYPLKLRDQTKAKVESHFLSAGDPGGLVNVAGAGVLASSKRAEAAQRLIEFLLSEQGQRYFVEQTFEYPLVDGVSANPALPSLSSLQPPTIDLSDLSDLDATLTMLQEVGLP